MRKGGVGLASLFFLLTGFCRDVGARGDCKIKAKPPKACQSIVCTSFFVEAWVRRVEACCLEMAEIGHLLSCFWRHSPIAIIYGARAMHDEVFTPRLGRMKTQGSRRGRKYLGQVIAAAARAGAKPGKRGSFDGSRMGRGASMGRVLGSRYGAAQQTRRAMVKVRLVKLGAKGLSAATAHMRYIQRDGVTRDGEPGALYSADQDRADGKDFLERAAGDRHQFRFIVSAEDGSEYTDLKPFIRRLMTQAEMDLGTRLDWVAVDHFNTGHPHTHVMLRGKDDVGQDLVIAREYFSKGLRGRAGEIVTLDLGPRTQLEIEERLRHDVKQERLTSIDRQLIKTMDANRMVGASARDAFQQSLRAGRLQKLEEMGLAIPVGASRWQLAEGVEDILRRAGERSDIVRTMQREISARNLERPGVDQLVHDGASDTTTTVTGRVIMRGLSDELHDRQFLLVDGMDGRVHYIAIGKGDLTEPTPEGSVIKLMPNIAQVRDVDRKIAEVAAAHGGRYSVDLHLRHDPSASERFAEAHVRRLEAMRRVSGLVEREPDGSWEIAGDHLARAQTYEQRLVRDRPVDVEVLSSLSLDRMARMDAATWIDRELTSGGEPARDAGFGREVRTALAARRQWLVDQGLADEENGHVRYRANLIATLARRELLRVATGLSEDLGLTFREPRSGERIEGIMRQRVDLQSGRYVLIEKSREFTLVPWRPTLERQIGRSVSGLMRGDGISWTFGRGRDGPSIT